MREHSPNMAQRSRAQSWPDRYLAARLIAQNSNGPGPFCCSNERPAVSLAAWPSEKDVARLYAATVLHDTPCEHICRSSQRKHVKAAEHRSNCDIAHVFTVPTARSLGQPVMGG
jgi:hypothetical protein